MDFLILNQLDTASFRNENIKTQKVVLCIKVYFIIMTSGD